MSAADRHHRHARRPQVAVPPSIRDAALAIGASHQHEMVFHHVLPLAMPGILTGTIMAAGPAPLGETAPLAAHWHGRLHRQHVPIRRA
jgi:ABC-type phosphate transport system permease subunit